MNYNFDQLLIPSFVMWVDNFLCNEGQAYTNTGGPLFPVNSSKFGLQNNVFASSFRPWVADSSVSGANIISGAYNGNTFIPRGISGLIINFQDSQVLLTGAAQLTGLTGNFAVKDYMIQYTSATEDDILFNNKFTFVPKYTFNQPITGISSNTITLPAIFIKYEQGESDSLQLGEGIVNTNSIFRCIVLADDAGLLDNILGRLRDKARKYFSVFAPAQLPFNYYGDLKSGVYNYLGQVNSQIGYTYVSTAKAAKFPEVINLDIGRDIFGGYVDMTCETYRNPAAIF